MCVNTIPEALASLFLKTSTWFSQTLLLSVPTPRCSSGQGRHPFFAYAESSSMFCEAGYPVNTKEITMCLSMIINLPKWYNLLILSVTFVSVPSLVERGRCKHKPSESQESFVWNTTLSLKHKHSVLTEPSPNKPNVVFCWTSPCIMFTFDICLETLHIKLLIPVLLSDKAVMVCYFTLTQILVICLDSHCLWMVISFTLCFK